MKKTFCVLLVVFVFLATFVLAACNPNDPFENPGDNLGGGREGEVAVAQDTTALEEVKAAIINNSALTEDDRNVSSEGATRVQPTDSVVEIYKKGTYLFEGEYGGIIYYRRLDFL